MARVRMITRTIESEVIEVMCLNTATAEVSICTYTTEPATEDKMLKALRNDYETDSFKLVAIQSHHTETALYGMTEAEFMSMAKLLPPR